MINLLAFKYSTSLDVAMQKIPTPVAFSISKKLIQSTIIKLLFEDNYNYVLVTIAEKLYICEPINLKNYSTREINYHPNQRQLP